MKFKKVLCFLCVIVFSCRFNNIDSDSSETDNFPYASKSELASWAEDSDILNYKLVRKMIKIHFESGLKNKYDWEGFEISDRPVIIYSNYNKPEYYEFIVSSEGSAVGTITAYATRKSSTVISYIIPWVRDYSSYNENYKNFLLYSEGYPVKMVCGVLGRSGSEVQKFIDINTGKTSDVIFQDDKEVFINKMQAYSNEELEQLGFSNWQEEYKATYKEIENNEADAKSFWDLVDPMENDFLVLSDNDIEEAFYNENRYTDINNTLTYDRYIIPAYSSDAMKSTFWCGWCAPSSICWIYRGLYSSYNGDYLPLDGEVEFPYENYRYERGFGTSSFYNLYVEDFSSIDKDQDNDGYLDNYDPDWVKPQSLNADGGLYYDTALLCDIFDENEGSTTFFKIAPAVKSITNNEYKALLTLFSANIHKNIRDKNMPVIVSKPGHVMIAFGSEYEISTWTRIYQFFGWTWSSEKTKTVNKFLLIQDNGYEISATRYKPFWSNNDNFLFLFHYRIVPSSE
ncbi:MAG: hypothetical protein PQJ46_16740 [Spirochaetales bacterium]|nr:hypothetical protein [Spirochaetales bacterium]